MTAVKTAQILLVEDNAEWRQDLEKMLQPLATIVPAASFREASNKVAGLAFEVAVVDLSIPEQTGSTSASSRHGLALLEELRRSPRNRNIGLIVVTGFGEHDREAFREYHVSDFIDKDDFDERVFVDRVRRALWQARIDRARQAAESRYRLTISFTPQALQGSRLEGPRRRKESLPGHATPFDAERLARQADGLNWMIRHSPPEQWRPQLKQIGQDVYAALAEDRDLLGDLFAARGLAERFSDLWIDFNGPRVGLGVPFELMRDEGDYLALDYIISRRLSGLSISRKTDPFHAFVRRLLGDGARGTLRVLVVGANSDGKIPGAEAEAAAVALDMETTLLQLGVPCDVTLLTGSEASYDRVEEALREGSHHVIHYAGHGRFNETLAEVSGLVLHDGTLTADKLRLLVSPNRNLQLVFLSCCLGARTAQQTDRGDFYGVMDALAQADVPLVVGYRWTVADAPAELMALSFYQTLWRTLSPGEALLQARRTAAMGTLGRDDDTWASPVLLMQNG